MRILFSRGNLIIHVIELDRSSSYCSNVFTVTCETKSWGLGILVQALGQVTTKALIAALDPNTCEVAARLAHLWDKPLLTWSCPLVIFFYFYNCAAQFGGTLFSNVLLRTQFLWDILFRYYINENVAVFKNKKLSIFLLFSYRDILQIL